MYHLMLHRLVDKLVHLHLMLHRLVDKLVHLKLAQQCPQYHVGHQEEHRRAHEPLRALEH